MDFFITGRAGGKTTMLIDWFAEDPEHSVIVCLDMNRRKYILRRLGERWPDINPKHWERNVLITPNAIDHMRGYSNQRVGIDDLDSMLHYWFGNVQLVTATGMKVKTDG